MRTDPLSRRQFLRGLGTAIALPFLPSLFPRAACAGDPPAAAPKPPLRMLFLAVPLGFGQGHQYAGGKLRGDPWIPQADGREYVLAEVAASLEPHRQRFSYVKGLSHARFRADSHGAEDVWLTGADTFADPSCSFSNTVSCDQVAAESPLYHAGVRHRCLSLGVKASSSGTQHGGSRTGGLSWTRQGIPISPYISPAEVFDALFGADQITPEERRLRLAQKRSVLDVTLDQQQRLAAELDARDRRKLDEVVSAIRDIEAQIQHDEQWLDRPKPQTTLQRPDPAIEPTSYRHAAAMVELIHAAFLTDSTRLITYHMPGAFIDRIQGYSCKHSFIHGGVGDAAHCQAIVTTDRLHAELLAALLERFTGTTEHDGEPLLHHTIGAHGSGDWGPSHDLRNLPLIVFGRGGGTLAANGVTRSYPNQPLANLWLTLLKAGGVKVDAFADSTGVLKELLA